MAAKISYLIVDIIVLSLQLIVIVCSGFFLFLSTREKRIRQNTRRLVLCLATTDFIFALAILPYTAYLVCSWNSVYIDLSPYYVMIGSTPLIVQLKLNLTLSISVAVERTLALSFPFVFRKLSYHSYATFCLLFGFLLAVFDLILEFSLSPIKAAPNCAAIGCFLSDKFRYYWGISNMMMGITVIVLTSLILVKLRAVQQQPNSMLVVVKSRERKFKQKAAPHCKIWANRTCTGILLISLVFVTLPSVAAGVVEMIGFSVFNALGPFYIVGILCAGAFNSVVYFALNKDMRALAMVYFSERRAAPVNPEHPAMNMSAKTQVNKLSSGIRY